MVCVVDMCMSSETYYARYPVLGALAISALVVSALFMLRVIQRTFYGEKNERFTHLPDVSFGLGLPRVILVIVLILFGLFPSLMYEVIQASVIPFIEVLSL